MSENNSSSGNNQRSRPRREQKTQNNSATFPLGFWSLVDGGLEFPPSASSSFFPSSFGSVNYGQSPSVTYPWFDPPIRPVNSSATFSQDSQPSAVPSSQKIPVDVVNTSDTITVYAEIPGVDKKDILIDFYNTRLTITASRSKPGQNPSTSELKEGKFERGINLPIAVTKKEAVSSVYHRGILTVKINKLLEEENRFSIQPEEVD